MVLFEIFCRQHFTMNGGFDEAIICYKYLRSQLNNIADKNK